MADRDDSNTKNTEKDNWSFLRKCCCSCYCCRNDSVQEVQPRPRSSLHYYRNWDGHDNGPKSQYLMCAEEALHKAKSMSREAELDLQYSVNQNPKEEKQQADENDDELDVLNTEDDLKTVESNRTYGMEYVQDSDLQTVIEDRESEEFENDTEDLKERKKDPLESENVEKKGDEDSIMSSKSDDDDDDETVSPDFPIKILSSVVVESSDEDINRNNDWTTKENDDTKNDDRGKQDEEQRKEGEEEDGTEDRKGIKEGEVEGRTKDKKEIKEGEEEGRTEDKKEMKDDDEKGGIEDQEQTKEDGKSEEEGKGRKER